MSLLGGESLLQETVTRLAPLIPAERVWVFTNEYLAQAVARQLPAVPRAQIVAEPVQRNTAPCIGLAAEMILARDPEAILGVFPSDHAVTKAKAFLKVVKLAADQACLGAIVVLGIQPRWPETGYGYMEFARPPALTPSRAFPVKQFREKPDLATAQR
jgi:mannose-1-phosphate guanylyltransferase